jgi:adenylyltransferase and sulfurtransferase
LNTSILIPAPPLAHSRYSRQLLHPAISLPGQHRLLSSSILIIGLGGLGCPAALYLAGAGVGRLGFVDADTVEESNLHRQIAHTEQAANEGWGKVRSVIRACGERNSGVEYVGFEERLANLNALGILGGEGWGGEGEGWDLVLDCTDNPATRYLISDICVLLGKPLVSGAGQRGEGQMVVLNYPTKSEEGEDFDMPEREPVARNGDVNDAPVEKRRKVLERGPCYRCIFPHPPAPEMVHGCNEIGILGPVVGCIGTLMASEAIRLIVKGAHMGHVDETRRPSMLLYNAWPADPKNMFRTIMMAGRRKGCVSCGEEEVLTKLGKKKVTREVFEGMDYGGWCGRVEDVKVLKKDERINAEEFLRRAQDGRVIDVREEHEIVLGMKVKDSINVPISKIMRDPKEVLSRFQADDPSRTYFICHQGNDSQIAARKLMDLGEKEGRIMGWIGDVAGGFVALEKLQQNES